MCLLQQAAPSVKFLLSKMVLIDSAFNLLDNSGSPCSQGPKVSSSLHPVWLLPQCLPLIPVWRSRMGPIEVTKSQCNPSVFVALPISLSSLSSIHSVCMASAQRTPLPNSPLFPLLCPPCWERVWAASPRVTLAVSQLCFSPSGDSPSSFTGCLLGLHNCSHCSHFGKNISRDFTLFCHKSGTNIINPSAGTNPRGLTPGRCSVLFVAQMIFLWCVRISS